MLKDFIAKDPKDPFPRYGLAMEYKNGGRLSDAAEVFDELRRDFPDYTPQYLHAGAVLAALGRAHEAESVYRAGIDACTRKGDFHAKGEPAKAYDLDFWLKPAGDKLDVVDVRIHKAPKRDGESWKLVTRSPIPWWWIPATEHPGETEEKRGWQVESAVHEHIATRIKNGVYTSKDDGQSWQAGAYGSGAGPVLPALRQVGGWANVVRGADGGEEAWAASASPLSASATAPRRWCKVCTTTATRAKMTSSRGSCT